MSFFTMVLKYKQVAEVIEVDIDHDLLETYINKVVPKPSDFLNRRSTPLSVKVYSGNVAQINSCLMDADAVIAIELIEHLNPNDLEGLPFTIFGFMQPKVALFTTPNAEFNVLFPNLSGFRHYDHKFEWTREQFEDWGHNLVSRYPDYEVSFEGIGIGPKGTEALGCCSQMALFVRKTESKIAVDIEENHDLKGAYKLVDDNQYPFFQDTRTDEQKILDSAESYIYRCRNNRWYNNEEKTVVPLKDVLSNVKCLSLIKLRDILVNANWEVIKSNTGELLVKFFDDQDELSDWNSNDDEQDNSYELPVANRPEEENWDDLEFEEASHNDRKPLQCEDVVDHLFTEIEKLDSSTTFTSKTEHEICNSETDTTLENEVSLKECLESNFTQQQSSVCRSNLMIAGEAEENSRSCSKTCGVTSQPNELYNLPTYQGPTDCQQFPHTPLNTPNEKNDYGICIYKNISCLSDCIDESNVSVSNAGLPNMYKSFSDGNESDIFYTPMSTFKKFKQQLHSFKNAISTEDSNESEDSLSPSDNNISFTNLKSQIPKCHSCPGSRQSVSAEELQRGSSCDILACQQDCTSISKAVDSGYPNSEQTMDMDLTPEQVDELLTESDSSLEHDDNSLPESPVNPAAGQVIALLGDNVENGDVANNNRDGEGNNAIGEIDGALLEFEAIIDEREEVHPLLAAVEGDFDSSDNELLDENKNNEHNEINEIQNFLEGDDVYCSSFVTANVQSLDYKPSVHSKLHTSKSEPTILVGKSLEKRFSNTVSSSISDQAIGIKFLKTPVTSPSIDDVSEIDSSDLSKPIIKLDLRLDEKTSSQSFNEIVSSGSGHTSSKSVAVLNTEYNDIENTSPKPSVISDTLNSALCSVPSVTEVELAVNERVSNLSFDEVSQSCSSEKAGSSNRLLCNTNKKTKAFFPIRSSSSLDSEVESFKECNSNLSLLLDQKNEKTQTMENGIHSEIALDESEMLSLGEHLNIENTIDNRPLACSSPNMIDLSQSELTKLITDENRTNSVQPMAKKSSEMSCDDMSWSSNDQIVCLSEHSNVENGDLTDLTLSSSCAIIEDLSIKDSQMTLCSEISSTVESNIFETSSESSFHEILPEFFGFNQFDSDVNLPQDANPFPEWLLNIFDSRAENSFVGLGFGDVEEEQDEIVNEERDPSYDVEGDLGGGGDPNVAQS